MQLTQNHRNSEPRTMEMAKRKKAGLLLDIPEDVICDILLKMPVKSLLRFKALNRYWCSLISSHRFAVAHLSKQANNAFPRTRKYGVIQVSNVSQQQLPRLSLYMYRRAEEENSDTVIVETVGLSNSLHLLEYYENANLTQVFGSWNGLLLIGQGNNPKRFVLWNPANGQEKWLPLNLFSDCSTAFMAGLGYDSSTDNYKAVEAIFDGSTRLTHVAIYNLRDNSWAVVENAEFPYGFSSNKPGITLDNGAPHWVLKRGSPDGLDNVIIYFDSVKENFKELPVPDNLVGAEEIFLGSCKGFLCAGVSNKVWIMEEYGVKESWTILMKIERYISTYSILTFQHLMSLRFPQKSNVLMVLDRNSVALYYNIGSKYKAVSFSGVKEGLLVAAYTDSLISPNNYV